MSLELKAGIVALILAVIAALGWFGYHMVEVDKSQAIVNAGQATTIGQQQTTIKQDASSTAITDTATASAAVGTQVVNSTNSAIATSAATQVQAIIQQYAGNTAGQVTYTPTTPVASTTTTVKPTPAPTPVVSTDPAFATPSAEDQAISKVQITSVWQSYCLANPSDTQCSSVPAVTQ